MMEHAENLHGVELVPAGPEDAHVVAAMLSPREVWRNFGYPRAPSTFRVRLMMRSTRMHAWLIRVPVEPAPVGSVVLFGTPSRRASLEFAIALADVGARGRHVASTAARGVEDLVFRSGLCREMWAWMDEGNAAVLRLARACGWALEDRSEQRLMVDGVARTWFGRRTHAAWCREKVCRDGTLPCPLRAAERPCTAA